MLRRNVRRMRRYPSLTPMPIGLPVVLLLLFVHVFGSTLGAGLPGGAGRGGYVGHVTPGILLIAVASASQGTAITVAMDMTEGVVARFRTMAIARSAVLTGLVLASFLQAMLCSTVVLAVALPIGFRPSSSPAEWLGVVGVMAMVSFAVVWFAVACGLVSESVETASNLPMPLVLLPILGSCFWAQCLYVRDPV